MGLAAFASFAMQATEVTLSMADATVVNGTLVPEKGNTKEHYQPIETFTVGDYTFECNKLDEKNTDPALYHLNATPTLRLYAGSVITISAPESMNIGSVTFVAASVKGLDDTNLPTCNVGGSFGFEDKSLLWNRPSTEDIINKIVITLPTTKGADGNNPNFQISKIVISDAAVEIPEPEAPVLFNKVTEIESGKSYAIVAETIMAGTIAKDYGYLSGSNAVFTDDAVETLAVNRFTFTAVDGGYTIQDNDSRYLFMTGEFNSFNFAAEMPAEGAVWSVSFDGEGHATITNELKNKTILYSTQYKSFGSYAEAEESHVLPMLYGETSGGSAIEAVEGDMTDAPVIYYNLQGVRVNNPENGLFIRVQGKKATKVMVR